MLLTRNLLYAAFALLLTLLGVAALYVLLFADFIAVTQLMVYVGGVLVLVLFGIMLSSRSSDSSTILSENINKTGGLLTAALLFGGLAWLILQTNFAELKWLAAQAPVAEPVKSTVSGIGINLMTTFALPFEVASLILLIALMGAAYLSTRPKNHD